MIGREPVKELWAVLDGDGAVMYSRGGSSTSPKLMVYSSKKKAEAALNNTWIKQVIPTGSTVVVKKIYSV